MKFNYKTRGNSGPEGKSRVCIIGHPDDFPLYFEELSNQILNWHNCAVWYTFDEIFALDEDSHFHISQMQLVIVMVTKRFFIEKQFCAEAALSLTEYLHIPLLPIVYDADIDELYAHFYKTLHYISPVTNDTYTTEISFEQKLQKFLKNILVDDEDLLQINKAFDASIFMSYRKQDREYALSLMKRIHENEYFQNVAIWYDEFLIPGNSFLSGINDKLQSCDLFAMVVTPHLLEAGNFVMDVEYKEALASHKTIFPVEMMQTDKQQLAQSFPLIPECVTLLSGAIFDRQLYEGLRYKLSLSNDTSAEKTYYLGLAYLNGINVEVNFSKALSLLTKAANNGDVAAFEQLITIYKEGQGVERNLQKALSIQDSLIWGLFEQYKATPSVSPKNKLYYHLFQIIESYEKEGLIEKIETYIITMEQLAGTPENSDLLTNPQNQDDLSIYTNCLMKYAALNRTRGNINNARNCYERCIDYRKRLAELSQTPAEQLLRLRALSASFLELADFELYDANQPDAAEYHYSYVKYLRECIVATCPKGDPAELGYRRDLANVLWRLGDVMCNQALMHTPGSSEAALQSYAYFQECLTKRLELLDEAKTEQAEDEIATAYLGLAKLLLYYGDVADADIETAYRYINNAVSITQRILKNNRTRQTIKRAARMLEMKSSVQSQKRDPEAAFLTNKEAYKLLEELVTQYNLPEDIKLLAGLYKFAGDLFFSMGQTDYMIRYYQKALKQWESLIIRFPQESSYQAHYNELQNIIRVIQTS